MPAPHTKGGQYLKDAVYAAIDGIVTTFAVVAGSVGASLSPIIVIILGLANLFADGFSMAAGNFLGSRSEAQLYRQERKREEKEMDTVPDQERREIREILTRGGYKGEKLETMLTLIMENKTFAVDLMMGEEIGLLKSEDGKEFTHAFVTFISFLVAGAVPLIPYGVTLFVFGTDGEFPYAVLFTAVALFAIGALRTHFTGKHMFIAGLEMLFVGGIAAMIAYGVGFFLKQIFMTAIFL